MAYTAGLTLAPGDSFTKGSWFYLGGFPSVFPRTISPRFATYQGYAQSPNFVMVGESAPPTSVYRPVCGSTSVNLQGSLPVCGGVSFAQGQSTPCSSAVTDARGLAISVLSQVILSTQVSFRAGNSFSFNNLQAYKLSQQASLPLQGAIKLASITGFTTGAAWQFNVPCRVDRQAGLFVITTTASSLLDTSTWEQVDARRIFFPDSGSYQPGYNFYFETPFVETSLPNVFTPGLSLVPKTTKSTQFPVGSKPRAYRSFQTAFNFAPQEWGIFVKSISKGVCYADFKEGIGNSKSLANTSTENYQPAITPPSGKSRLSIYPRPTLDRPIETDPFVIPTQSTYMFINEFSVALLDGTQIYFDSINVSFDADSYEYRFSGSLADTSQIPLLRTDGEPVILNVAINAFDIAVIVKEVQPSRTFGSTTASVSGAGLTTLLSQPYSRLESLGGNSEAVSINTLAQSLVPYPWVIEWGMTNVGLWSVPTNAFSYSNMTPIQALGVLAQSIGAMLVPHPTEKRIKIIPRYPVQPWVFQVAEPDITIPESILLSTTDRNPYKVQSNGVYLHGGEVQGVQAFARIGGTAGELVHQTQSNPLLTHSYACRSLAERVLASQYTQPSVKSFTTPVDGQVVPFMEVGQFVKLTRGGEDVYGVINSTSVSATSSEGASEAYQTCQIGEDTANQWVQLKGMLPNDPQLLGKLTTNFPNGTCRLDLFGGGSLQVRGSGVINKNYYIRSGRLDGEAPDYPVVDEIIL